MCLELTNGHNILDYARKEMPGYTKLYQLVVDAYSYWQQHCQSMYQKTLLRRFLGKKNIHEVFYLGL